MADETSDQVAAVEGGEEAAGDVDAGAMADAALNTAQQAVDTIAGGDGGAAPVNLPDFNQVLSEADLGAIDMLSDVDLDVRIELGRTHMLVEDVLKLGDGAVVELDKLAGDPVDVFVNDRLVARGEVLVLNDNFCVRVNEIVADVEKEVEEAAAELAAQSEGTATGGVEAGGGEGEAAAAAGEGAG